MIHTVYTRCKYDTDKEVSDRLKLSLQTVIPSLISQTGNPSPFRWTWLCHPRHAGMITAALLEGGWKGEVLFNEISVSSKSPIDKVGRLGIPVRRGDEQIQTSLDSDDVVHPHWIREIQRSYRPGKTFIIYWHPHRYVLATKKWYRPARVSPWVSMFYSVYNPTEKVHVYLRKHNEMQTITHAYPDAREGYCGLTIHGSNLHTTLKKWDSEVPTPKGFS